jgi:hypothetical protein
MTTGAAEDRVEMLGAIPESSGQKPRVAGSGVANVTGRKATHWPEAATGLMEKIVSRGNMMAAYSRVVSNKGAPGVNEMPVTALKSYLQKEWPRIKEELLAGVYHPQPVRKVEIPKPGGGTRMLGIAGCCSYAPGCCRSQAVYVRSCYGDAVAPRLQRQMIYDKGIAINRCRYTIHGDGSTCAGGVEDRSADCYIGPCQYGAVSR